MLRWRQTNQWANFNNTTPAIFYHWLLYCKSNRFGHNRALKDDNPVNEKIVPNTKKLPNLMFLSSFKSFLSVNNVMAKLRLAMV